MANPFGRGSPISRETGLVLKWSMAKMAAKVYIEGRLNGKV